MIEYSLAQFMGLAKMVIEFCNKQKLSIDEMENCRVRLHEPLRDGAIKLDVGLPIKAL